jgi:hypothetical protein
LHCLYSDSLYSLHGRIAPWESHDAQHCPNIVGICHLLHARDLMGRGQLFTRP